jgi:hypothetical protein
VMLSILRFVALTVSKPVEKIRYQNQITDTGSILMAE